MINYKERIKELIKRKEDLKKELLELNKQEEIEKKEKIEEITYKYEQKRELNTNFIQNADKELSLINEKIKDASTFNINDITPIIVQIISTIEDKEYVYDILDLDGLSSFIVYPALEKVNDDNSITYDDDNGVICFYEGYDILKLTVDFGVFNYLETFINYVIKYRLYNSFNTQEITFEELTKLTNEFLNLEDVKKLKRIKRGLHVF